MLVELLSGKFIDAYQEGNIDTSMKIFEGISAIGANPSSMVSTLKNLLKSTQEKLEESGNGTTGTEDEEL